MDLSQINLVIETIDSLYISRATSETIKQTEASLQELQRSPNAIQLADALLSNTSNSLNVQFFAASTYAVQLTRAKNGLSQDSKIVEDGIDYLLQRVLTQIKFTVEQRIQFNINNGFVTKKLFQVLCIIFSSYKRQDWPNPLQTLIDHLDVSHNNDPYLIRLLLDFCDIMTSDFIKMGKLDNESSQIHETVHSEIYPTFTRLVLKCLSPHLKNGESSLVLAGISSISLWFQYIKTIVESFTLVRYRSFGEDLLWPLIGLLQTEDGVLPDEVFIAITMFFSDVFEEKSNTLDPASKEELNRMIRNTEWCSSKFNKFYYHQEEDSDLAENFIDFIIKFFEMMDLKKFVKYNLIDLPSPVIQFLLSTSSMEGPVIIHDRISRKLIDFWCEVLEVFTDEFDAFQSELEDPQLLEQLDSNFKNLAWSISKIYYSKIQLSVMTNDSYDEYKEEIQSFRNDTMELFDIIFSVVGPALIEVMVQHGLLNNSGPLDVDNMEAGLFILNSLCSNFSNEVDERVINSLDLLFHGNFISSYNNTTSNLSGEHTKTCVKFLATISFFYKSNANKQYLFSVMDYLLSLIRSKSSQELIISRAILDICNECRHQFIDSMERFELVMVDILPYAKVANFTREKIINGISFIVQSMKDPSLQEQYVYNLVKHISGMIMLEFEKSQQNPETLDYITSLLGSIVSIGKGLSLPDDFKETESETYQRFLDYYSKSYKVQEELVTLTINLDHFLFKDGFQQILLILKVGLMDDFGPFVFRSEDIINFTSQRINMLGNDETLLKSMLELINRLVVCRMRSSGSVLVHPPLNPGTVTGIIRLYIMNKIEVIREDPSLLIASFNILTSIVTIDPTYIMQEEDIEVTRFIADLALKCLDSKEKFLIKSVCKFWTTLTLMKSTKSVQQQSQVKQVIEFMGLEYTYKVFDSAFKAARSDLEQYGNIVVALISKFQLVFTQWAKLALDRIHEERLNNGDNGLENREVFLKKLLLTRGLSKKTNAILKEYWITTNGLVAFT